MTAVAHRDTLLNPVVTIDAAARAAASDLHKDIAELAVARLGRRVVDDRWWRVAGSRPLAARLAIAPGMTARALDPSGGKPMVAADSAARASSFDLHGTLEGWLGRQGSDPATDSVNSRLLCR